jgi:hypothetical protein
MIMCFLPAAVTMRLHAQSALDFDGVNDFAEVPHDTSLEFHNAVTAEIVMNIDAVPPSGTSSLFHKKVASVYSTFGIILRSGELQANVYHGQATTVVRMPGGNIPLGEWNHVAFTYDGTAKLLYFNGELVDSVPDAGMLWNDPTPVSFGRYDASYMQYFDGRTDEVRLWNVARTGDEIRATMNVELTGNEPGLVGYWKFNEGVGDSIHDSSPWGNDGRLGSTDGPDGSDPAWLPHEFPPPFIDLVLSPIGPTTVPIGGILDFNSLITNNTGNTRAGDHWLSLVLPDESEVLVPEGLLVYPNPLSGQVFPFDTVVLDNSLFVPARADTGAYSLIGRIGEYPALVVDLESFEFRVSN